MSVPPSPESTIVASPDQLLLPYSPDSSILTTPQSPSEDMTLVTPKRAGITAADVSASRSLLSSGGRRRSVDADSALNVSSKLRGQMGRARPLSKEETLKKRKAVLSNRYDVRENRVKNFFKEVLMRHEMKVFQNRGISIEVLKKKNLGNFLNITKRTIKDLDFDVNQTAPALPSDPIQVGGVNIILRTITAADTDDLEPAIAAADLGVFENAERVVREEFAAKNVAADLSSVIHERFAVDLAIDIGTGEVAGAAEYVFMRKYLWLDAIATSKEARGCGVGTLLLDRLVAAARWRGKALLCFALNDVVDWYLARGFKVCNAFPREEWHIGQFLIMY
ncbi:hypothetical protein HK101_008178 [Irineochytrium annulatum]|nr:hypothetical protein HK101_008178 [Irineochytrium annulatum]